MPEQNQATLDVAAMRALLAAVGGAAGVLLGALLEGPRKINLLRLAEHSGYHHSVFVRAKSSLIERGLIGVQPGGALTLDPAGVFGLAGRLADLCRNGPDAMLATAPIDGRKPRRSGTQFVHGVHKTGSCAQPGADGDLCTPCTNQPSNCAKNGDLCTPCTKHNPPLPHTPSPHARSIPAGGRAGTDTGAPARPTPPLRLTRREQAAAECGGHLPGDVTPNQKILDKMINPGGIIDRWFPMAEHLKTELSMHRYQIETDWMFKALKRAKLKNVQSPGLALLLRYMTGWDLTGPQPGPEDRYDDDLRMLPSRASEVDAPPWRPNGTPPSSPPVIPQFRMDDDARAKRRAEREQLLAEAAARRAAAM